MPQQRIKNTTKASSYLLLYLHELLDDEIFYKNVNNSPMTKQKNSLPEKKKRKKTA